MWLIQNFASLIFPLDDQSLGAIHNWRWRVTLVIIALMAAFVFAFSPFGFAFAGDMRELKARVDISTRIALAQEIRLYQQALCKTDDRDSIYRAIERLQVEYVAVTGVRYPDVSSCGPH